MKKYAIQAINLNKTFQKKNSIVSALTDFKIYIPMAGKVDCLNVSVAAGVCMFEAVRQRSSLSS